MKRPPMNVRRPPLQFALPLAMLLAMAAVGSALARHTAADPRRVVIVHRYDITTRAMYYTFGFASDNALGR